MALLPLGSREEGRAAISLLPRVVHGCEGELMTRKHDGKREYLKHEVHAADRRHELGRRLLSARVLIQKAWVSFDLHTSRALLVKQHEKRMKDLRFARDRERTLGLTMVRNMMGKWEQDR